MQPVPIEPIDDDESLKNRSEVGSWLRNASEMSVLSLKNNKKLRLALISIVLKYQKYA